MTVLPTLLLWRLFLPQTAYQQSWCMRIPCLWLWAHNRLGIPLSARHWQMSLSQSGTCGRL